MKRTISLIVALAIMATMCVGLTLNVAAEAEVIESLSHACEATGHNDCYKKTEANSVVMQSVTVADSWVGIIFPGWGANNGAAKVEVFAFNTDLETSASGVALLTENVEILQKPENEHRFSDPLAAGKYVIKFSEFTGTCYLGFDIKRDDSTLTSFSNLGGGGGPEDITGRGLVINYIMSKDLSAEPLTSVDVDSVSDFSSDILNAKYTLTTNIEGDMTFSGCKATIDLKGKTWSGSLNTSAFVTIVDSVGGGKIISGSDTITVKTGKLTIDGDITVEAQGSGNDAIFFDEGEVYVKGATLIGAKAGIDLDQKGQSGKAVIDGVKFVAPATTDERTCAIEFRHNNKTLELKGNIEFGTNNKILVRNECNKSLEDLISYEKSSSVSFTELEGTIEKYGSTWKVFTIDYTYTAPVAKEPTITAGTLVIDTGIKLGFIVENATENTEVKVNGNALDRENNMFVFGDFGPQAMGDVFTAEVYENGVKVGKSFNYSVKEYCVSKLVDEDEKLVTLVKDILNYGAKAQVYKNYKTNELVNNGITDFSQFNEDMTVVRAQQNGNSADAIMEWNYANVKFGSTVELLFGFSYTFSPEDYDKVEKVVITIDGEDTTYTSDKFITVDGGMRVLVDCFKPDQFASKIKAVAYDNEDKKICTLEYSINSYVDYVVNVSEFETSYVDLVKALSVYGDSLKAWLTPAV